MQTSDPTVSAVSAGRKPRDDEIDVYGLTHPGNVRRENQDHFLISSLHKRVQVYLTSLPTSDLLSQDTERLAFFAMVADGVGGSAGGEAASRLAVAAITRYVTEAMHCYYSADLADEERFPQALEEAALRVHSDIQGSSPTGPLQAHMATTLTLWIGLWPRAYLLQVGDSRCYLLRNGELIQLSRDQTLAQDLVDRGVFRRSDALRSPFANVLSSSLGGPQTAPIVTDMQQEWGNVGLLCSDGLTKHVPDTRIRERLMAMTSAKQVCEDLLRDALDAGGTDNVTVVVGRTLRKDAT
jgi:serine/threonine protein phosphatase PrpC